MKKILKHGRNQNVAKCGMCGCQFTYENEDMYPVIANEVTEGYIKWVHHYVECPECGGGIILKSRSMLDY